MRSTLLSTLVTSSPSGFQVLVPRPRSAREVEIESSPCWGQILDDLPLSGGGMSASAKYPSSECPVRPFVLSLSREGFRESASHLASPTPSDMTASTRTHTPTPNQQRGSRAASCPRSTVNFSQAGREPL